MKKLCFAVCFLVVCFSGLRSQTLVSVHNYYFYYKSTLAEPTLTLYTLSPLNKRLFFSTYALTRPSWSQIVVGFDYAATKWMIVGFKSGIQSNQNGSLWRYSPSLVLQFNKFQFFGVYEWGGIKDRSQMTATYKLGNFKPGLMSVQSLKLFAAGPMLEFDIPKTPFSVYGSAMFTTSGLDFASQFGIYYRIKPKVPPKPIKEIVPVEAIEQIVTETKDSFEEVVVKVDEKTIVEAEKKEWPIEPAVKFPIKENNETETLESQSNESSIKNEVQQKSTELNFYIVVASYSDKENAKVGLQEWKEKGLNVSGAYSSKRGFYYIVAGKYSTEEEANQALPKIRQNYSKYAWVLEK